ncbi:MAG: MinD/ParA family protein [Pseudohongiella sp.]|uniref:MinD/ParA family protein n=1 Tax=Pseudohongiella sp. TaxID=1979412 RepID=UPI0034A05456
MATVDLPLNSVAKKSLSQARTTAPHVIAVTSGKGGVGKSSISVNLGIALSRMGHKVCLLDADTGLANINILLGLTPRLSLEHVLFGNKSIADVMLDGPHGLKVIPGANGIVECIKLQPRQHMQLTRQLATVEGEYDYLLVDTAAGIGDDTMDFVRAAQQTIIVVTTEPTSLTDAFSMIKLLRRRGKKSHFHVVVNMCHSTKQAREVFQRFAGAVEKYIGVKLNYLGFILQDESLRAAVTMQSPVTLFPETDPSCKNFFRLGQALTDTLGTLTPKASFSAYWQSQYRRQNPAQVSAATSGKDKRPVTSKNADTQVTGAIQREPLSKLRTRLLTLIAQGDVTAQELTALIEELNKAALRMYPDARPVAQKTGSPEPINSPEPVNSLEPINSPERINSPARRPSDSEASSLLKHRYDESRFGSQQQLLATLRQHTDKPLIKLLGEVAGCQ